MSMLGSDRAQVIRNGNPLILQEAFWADSRELVDSAWLLRITLHVGRLVERPVYQASSYIGEWSSIRN